LEFFLYENYKGFKINILMLNKAIFLDRDGVINKDLGLIYKKSDIILFRGVRDSLKFLKSRGFYIFVITNQPVIARGLIDEEGVGEINLFLNSKLDNLIDKFYFCPHHPNADILKYRKVCDCRKPSSGMILQAKEEFDIDLDKSWMIGDRVSDIICGGNAGCKTILIKSETDYPLIESGKKFEEITPDYFFKDLLESSKFIGDITE